MLGIKLENLRGDLFGGLTAGVVALPLALAFGEASGAGPIAGLYGAIIVGFFAALFGEAFDLHFGEDLLQDKETILFKSGLLFLADDRHAPPLHKGYQEGNRSS